MSKFKSPTRALFLGSKLSTVISNGVFFGASSGPFRVVGSGTPKAGYKLRVMVGNGQEALPLVLSEIEGKRLPTLLRRAEGIAHIFSKLCTKASRKRS